MAAPEKRAAAPLFDRLTDLRPSEPAEKEPVRALTISGLVDSVTAEVSRIMNSRAHRRGTEGFDSNTVLDYGVPDFAPVVPTAGDERGRLQKEIARRIAASEPRLKGVEVELHYDKKKPLQLGGVITASVQFGNVSEPVSFELRTSGTTPVITERAVTEEAAAEDRVRAAGASVIEKAADRIERAMNSWDETLRYYQNELSYLRRAGEEFARQYPKIASRLELTPEGSADPHVDRMISSFAFLTARIQRQIHSEFPEISTALLGSLYPQLVQPVAPMTIAHFDVDPDQGKITTGYKIARHMPLFAQSSTGQTCLFRTCYDVTLWPLTVNSARFESPAQFDFLDRLGDVAGVLRLQLSPQSGLLSELELKTLRFHINGESTAVNSIYELLFSHVVNVALLPEGENQPVWLGPNALRPVGFEPDHEVIPCPPNALPGYRLLQEYFLFPQKFHFFDIDGLERHRSENVLDILILLDQVPPDKIQLRRSTFLLGCTPAINLFRNTTEPIRVDQRQFEYRLVGDYRKERTTEIHSIQSVSASSNRAEPTTRVEPFFSNRHRLDGREGRAWWYARRVPTEREDLPGTDILLSFVDLDFDPTTPPSQVVYAHTLCTNRDFALQIPSGASLQIEDAAPLVGISCLNKPTPPVYPPLGGPTLWRLVSNLTLNFLSFSTGPESLEALREILRLYSFSDQPWVHQQIQGISEIETRPVTRKIGRDGWRGFCYGTEVTLTFDESLYVGTGSFLLSAVLNRFFALYANTNSFTELVVRSRQRAGVWKRWAPMTGYQPLV